MTKLPICYCFSPLAFIILLLSPVSIVAFSLLHPNVALAECNVINTGCQSGVSPPCNEGELYCTGTDSSTGSVCHACIAESGGGTCSNDGRDSNDDNFNWQFFAEQACRDGITESCDTRPECHPRRSEADGLLSSCCRETSRSTDPTSSCLGRRAIAAGVITMGSCGSSTTLTCSGVIQPDSFYRGAKFCARPVCEPGQCGTPGCPACPGPTPITCSTDVDSVTTNSAAVRATINSGTADNYDRVNWYLKLQSASNFNTIPTGTTSTNTNTLTGLTTGTAYTVKAEYFSSTGARPAVSCTTRDFTTLSISAPTGLLASCSAILGRIDFSWASVTTPVAAARYAIRVNDLSTAAAIDYSYDNIPQPSSGRASYTLSNSTIGREIVIAGHTYQWWVYAVDSAGNFSDSSAIASVSCAALGCTTLTVSPTALSFNIGDSGATLRASGAQGTLSWSTGNSSIASLSSTTGNPITVTPGNTAGTTFITARDTGGGGCLAESVSVSVRVSQPASCGGITPSCCLFFNGAPTSCSNDAQCQSFFRSTDPNAQCYDPNPNDDQRGYCVKGTYTPDPNTGLGGTCPAPRGGTLIPVPTMTPIPPAIVATPPPPPEPGEPVYTIEGVVFIDANRNGRRDTGENQCYEGTARLTLQGIGSISHTQDRGCNNKYRFTGLGQGNYRLIVDPITEYQSTMTPEWTLIFRIPI